MSYQKKYRSKSNAGTKASTYSSWPPKANAEVIIRRMLAPAPGLSRIGGGVVVEELEQSIQRPGRFALLPIAVEPGRRV